MNQLEESDSIQNSNFRSQGSFLSGQLVKGVLHKPYSKMVCSSIPSRNDQVIAQNESKVGFNRSISGLSHRKLEASQSQLLEKKVVYESQRERRSQNANCFVSKTERSDFIRQHPNSGPGPGYYSDGQIGFTDKMLRNFKPNLDFKRQKKEIQKPSQYQMGPGDYNPKKPLVNQNSFSSSFLTKYQRDEYRKFQETPAPGQYKQHEYQNNRYSLNSVFKQKLNQPITKMENLLNYINSPDKNYKIEKKQVLDETRNNWMFLNLNQSRFDDKLNINNNINLGPGVYSSDQYLSLESKCKEKNFVSSSMFLSIGQRNPYDNYDKRLGPNLQYKAELPQKKIVHNNLNQIWIN